MSSDERKLIEKLEETAAFLRPLNYFWYKALKKLLSETSEEGWLSRVSEILQGRNQLGDLFVSPPKEREQFRILLEQLQEALEASTKKEA